MRFILLLKGNSETESGIRPSAANIEAMTAFYAKMNAAGVVLGAEGLHASSKDSARVTFGPAGDGAGEGERDVKVKGGPYAPSEELVAGYWVIKVKDLEEAVGWVKKCPMAPGGTIEIRRIAELDDFAENVSDEVRENSEKMRKETEERVKGMK